MIKRVTSYETLMRKARAFGQAKLNGDQTQIDKTYNELIQYEELCKNSDEMQLSYTHGELYDKN